MRHGDEPPLQGLSADPGRGRGGPASADGHSRQLQGSVRSGRRHRAVRHGAHESDEERRGLLCGDRQLVKEGHQGGPEVR